MQSQSKVWATGDGRHIPICDLADRHLIKIIKYLKRPAIAQLKREVNTPLFNSVFDAEMTKPKSDKELDLLLESVAKDYLPEIYFDLVAEAKRRQLKIC